MPDEQDGGGTTEQRYRLLAENAAEVVAISSPDGHLRWISPSVEPLLGWTPPQLQGQTVLGLVHPDDLPTVVIGQQRLDEGEPASFQARVRRSEGGYRWIAAYVHPVLDSDGRIVERVASWRDLEAERAAREQLAESQRRYRMLAENASDLVFETDRDRRFAWVSPNVRDVLGWDVPDLLGMQLNELMRPDVAEALAPDRATSNTGQNPSPQGGYLLELRTKSGDYRWLSGRVQPRATEYGEPAGVVAGLHDVTDLIRAQEDLRLLAENTADVVLRIDQDDRATWVSPAVQRLLGYPPEELLTDIRFDLVHPDDAPRVAQALTSLRAGQADEVTLELRLRHRSGGYGWWEASARRVEDRIGKQQLVVAFWDVDEVKRARDLAQQESDRRVAAVESMLDPHVLLEAVRDDDGRVVDFTYTDANEAACVYNRTPREKLVGARLLDVLPGHAGTGLLAMYTAVVDSGEPLVLDGYTYPQEILADERAYDIRAVRVGDGLSYTWRDVTDREQAQRALAASEARLRSVEQALGEGLVLQGPDGAIVSANPAAEAILGSSVDQLAGRTSTDPRWRAVHEDGSDFPGDAHPAMVTLATGQACRDVVMGVHKPDGTLTWILVNAEPIPDADGGPGSVVTSFTDITTQRQAQQAVTASREHLAATLDSLLDPHAAWEPVRDHHGTVVDFTCVDMNRAALAEMGLPRDEVVGHRMNEVFPGHGAVGLFERYRQVVDTGGPLSVDGFSYGNEPVGPHRRYDIRAILVGTELRVTWRDVTDQLITVEMLADREGRLRMVLEASSDVVLALDEEDRYTWVSPSVSDVLGWRPEDLLGRTGADFIPAEDLAALVTARANPNAAGVSTVEEFRFRTKAGQLRWMSGSSRALPDDSGMYVGRVVTLHDVDDAVRDRRALAQSEESFRTAMQSSAIGYSITASDGRFQAANPAMCQLLGRDEAWLLGHHLADVVHPDDLSEVLTTRASLLDQPGVAHQQSLRFVGGDGGTVWGRVSVVGLRDQDGRPDRMLAQVEDITDERAAQEALAYQAFHDPLTGLRNRAWILDILSDDLHTASRRGSQVAVLFVDLDNFKVINDSLGHSAGDDVLAMIAERLRSALRSGERVGRFGGDEFVVVIPDMSDPQEAEHVAARLCATVATDLQIQGHRVVPTVSIGIALSTHRSTAESLLRDTDSALYRAKAAGRGRWHFFDAAMHDRAVSRLTVEDELRAAVQQSQFTVVYQPIVRLTDGALFGHEALLRWNHPTRGLLAPAYFLEVAEDSGLIADIDLQVLTAVCELIVAEPDVPGTISVNVSPVDLARADWYTAFVSSLALYGVPPGRVVVEVTETAVLNMLDPARADLHALRDHGVGIHVDDFGTGFSSIALLRDLPVTGLKLDRSFVADLTPEDSPPNALAAGLAGLVNGLHLTGIAEGIQTTAQADILRAQGWQYGQGYLYGRPAPRPITR